ncbi:hypothetical protein FJZ39_01610 [Candidatus Saccharibacteria bacterium]|nr:hypothetical protein [Candidatus Saccharibacteria bacterium]
MSSQPSAFEILVVVYGPLAIAGITLFYYCRAEICKVLARAADDLALNAVHTHQAHIYLARAWAYATGCLFAIVLLWHDALLGYSASTLTTLTVAAVVTLVPALVCLYYMRCTADDDRVTV